MTFVDGPRRGRRRAEQRDKTTSTGNSLVPTISTGGAPVYYEERGQGDIVVFVHGIPTDHRAWTGQLEAFSAGRKVVTVSRRYAFPNQRTGDLSDSTVQNNSADIEGLVKTVASGRVDLVGHSYGGFICAYLAAARPELVRSLVLVEPAVSTLLVANQSSQAQLLGLLLRSPSVALSGRKFQKQSLAPSLAAVERGDFPRAVELNVDGVQDLKGAFAGLPDETKRMMLDNAKTIAELRTEFPRFTSGDARRIASRTLIVNGERSPLWLRRIGELLQSSIAGSEKVVIPGTRHFPHMEAPRLFNEKVLGFMEAGKA